MRLDLAFNGLATKPLADRLRGEVGCFSESAGIPLFNLAPHGRTLAESDCGNSWRCRPTAHRNRFELDRPGESAIRKVPLYRKAVVVTMRSPGHEARRIIGKQRGENGGYGIGEFIFLDAIPYIEEENPAGLENAASFGKGFGFVGEEHYSELAYHRVKRAIRKR